jgi:hypothetical protein
MQRQNDGVRGMNPNTDFEDLLEYRNSVRDQPETALQKITLEIIDKAIENLRNK